MWMCMANLVEVMTTTMTMTALSSMSDSELKALLAIDGVNGWTQLDLRETQISPVEVEKLRAQGPEMPHSEGGLNVRYVVGME